ncbi:hypothetical protein F7731_23870 [Cytobacillus depressus]|uniref:Uncharacterized protein n=1 Tax=Cytobacillus depressus TaxID=1602942 RepID=A0A6L3V0L9_9BACI|nr:hypothetical protein [Cytobacillus depressus]KAB2328991.1 hypothetical protein F7731_23870 [Cytobacillus depressus]
MKKIILSLIIVLATSTSIIHSEQLPACTVILEPKVDIQKNAKGVAIIYNIERKFNDHRTSLGIQALHMPEPSVFGNYDSYQVLAYIPNEVSWIFSLTRYADNNWVGNWDEISPIMRPTQIKVRPINLKTNNFGPSVLEGKVSCSK